MKTQTAVILAGPPGLAEVIPAALPALGSAARSAASDAACNP